MEKKMTNLEMVNAFNSLVALQKVEKEVFEKRGKRLLQGRVKISYAINKNLSSLENALKPYNETIKKLTEEMRDTDAEKKAIEEARKEGKNPNDVEMIFRSGIKKEDYIEKRNEIFNIETEVDVYEVDLELFDGIELNSSEIGMLMFMIRE